MLELGISGLHPLKLYAPPAVRKNAYAHIIMTLRGTCKFSKNVERLFDFVRLCACVQERVCVVHMR